MPPAKANKELRLFSGRKPWLKIVIATIVIIAPLSLASLIIYKQHTHKNISSTDLTSLINTGDCSKGIKATDNNSAVSKSLDSQIAIESYRAECFRHLARYDKALKSYGLLKSYYIKKGDSNSVAIVNTAITTVKNTMQYPKEMQYHRTSATSASKTND